MIVMLARLLAVLLLLCTFAAPARADIDYSDIWYEGPLRAGWGVNLAQNDNAIFATFFVYDVNKNPTWFGGTLLRVTDGTYSGALYTVRGAYYGTEPFDPAQNVFTPAGSMTFTATDPTQGTITYTVNGVSVAKFIQRQTLVGLSVAGLYVGAERYTLTGSGCASQGVSFFIDQYIVTQTPVAPGSTESALAIEIDDSDGALICTFRGTATQRGRVLDAPNATSDCTNSGTTVPTRLYDIRLASNGGLEFRWTSQFNSTCTQEGRVNAVRQ